LLLGDAHRPWQPPARRVVDEEQLGTRVPLQVALSDELAMAVELGDGQRARIQHANETGRAAGCDAERRRRLRRAPA